jgi:signal transduction histidine kinase/CheY-like chemotaxis protein/HPt (histidine-containing phosphotransfer) domain-containing protein
MQRSESQQSSTGQSLAQADLRPALIAAALALIASGALLAAAVLLPQHALWLGIAALAPLAAAWLGWRVLAGVRVPAAPVTLPPAGATMPSRRSESTEAAVSELRHELERHKELERDLRKAKQEAEAAMLAKGEFLATMSHEIRTPLNGIIPLLDILLSSRLADDQRDYLATAYQSSKQLLSIVDDILDYSKIEANRLELETVGLNIKDTLDSVTRLLSKNAEAKGLKFATGIDPSVRLAMRGDPVRLRQVLTNLVSNAIKFTDHGQVSVEVKKRSETRTHAELVFSVRDTGVGISVEQQARLFAPFVQADASTTRVHGGTGLGLVICKRIVELMGGQIGVRSEPGKGSTFWVAVPLMKAVGDVAPARTEVHGSRALLVTTDQAILRRVGGFLSAWGVQYVQTSVPAEALARMRQAANAGDTWSFDFLLLDWGAMKNSALGLARNVLRDDVLGGVRIIAITGEDEVPAELRGAVRFGLIGRQFSDVELRGAMQRLLDAESSASAPAIESLLPAPLAVTRVEPQPRAAPATAIGSPGAAIAPAAPAPVALRSAGRHVLLVEDNAVNRQVAQRLLSLIGVTYEHAENGKVALEAIERNVFDAVLMDCQMPVMDGYAATRAIRRLEAEGKRGGRLSVIAMTANAMAGDREKCLAAGMDDYMSKPLNRALLEQTLRKYLGAGVGVAAALAAPSAVPAPVAQTAAPRAPTPAARAPAAYAGSSGGSAPNAVSADVVQDLLEMMGGEFTDLVRVYLEDTPRSIAQLETAAASNSIDGLIAPAHSLKSTSANLGALHLSDLAKRIEHGARTGRLGGEPVLLVAELGVEFRRVSSELNRLLANA